MLFVPRVWRRRRAARAPSLSLSQLCATHTSQHLTTAAGAVPAPVRAARVARRRRRGDVGDQGLIFEGFYVLFVFSFVFCCVLLSVECVGCWRQAVHTHHAHTHRNTGTLAGDGRHSRSRSLPRARARARRSSVFAVLALFSQPIWREPLFAARAPLAGLCWLWCASFTLFLPTRRTTAHH